MSDRTYWRERPGLAWHAYVDDSDSGKALCGRWNNRFAELADRVPAAGHLCGSCARVLAAQTDVES